MNRFQILLVPGMIGLFGWAGCTTTGDDGPSLFTTPDDESAAEEVEVSEEDRADENEFGYKVEDTVCVKQLHGGCVPNSYKVFESATLGLNFRIPSDWSTVSTKETEVSFVPQNEEEDGITRLFVWRESGVNPTYETAKGEILDAGKGTMGYFDVTWEIYEGELDGYPAQSEWVTLTVDPYNPWINFVFMLVTEPEHFEPDQAVLNAAVSSVWEESEGLTLE